MTAQYAILIDTGFFYRNMRYRTRKNVSAKHIMEYADHLKKLKHVDEHDLLVVYFNTGGTFEIDPNQPMSKYIQIKNIKNPSNRKYLGNPADRNILASSYFARMRTTTLTAEQKAEMNRKWEEKRRLANNMVAYQKFAQDIHEKGVNMSVSLDLAMLALREMVFAVIVVTDNADYIPAFKFVRSMGTKVILDTLGCKAHPELIRSANVFIDGSNLCRQQETPMEKLALA